MQVERVEQSSGGLKKTQRTDEKSTRERALRYEEPTFLRGKKMAF